MQPVSYHDAATDQDVTLDQALAAGQATYPDGTLTASSARRHHGLQQIGLMGHSRGGEGVVTAGTLNEALAAPVEHQVGLRCWRRSTSPAPTLPDVVTTTLLPYCDGDVSDQQGQHFYADSRGRASPTTCSAPTSG